MTEKRFMEQMEEAEHEIRAKLMEVLMKNRIHANAFNDEMFVMLKKMDVLAGLLEEKMDLLLEEIRNK